MGWGDSSSSGGGSKSSGSGGWGSGGGSSSGDSGGGLLGSLGDLFHGAVSVASKPVALIGKVADEARTLGAATVKEAGRGINHIPGEMSLERALYGLHLGVAGNPDDPNNPNYKPPSWDDFKADIGKHIGYGELLKDGNLPGGINTKRALGMTLDVGLDPLTYVTGGSSAVGEQGVKGALHLTAKEGANLLEKAGEHSGQVNTALEKGLASVDKGALANAGIEQSMRFAGHAIPHTEDLYRTLAKIPQLGGRKVANSALGDALRVGSGQMGDIVTQLKKGTIEAGHGNNFRAGMLSEQARQVAEAKATGIATNAEVAVRSAMREHNVTRADFPAILDAMEGKGSHPVADVLKKVNSDSAAAFEAHTGKPFARILGQEGDKGLSGYVPHVVDPGFDKAAATKGLTGEARTRVMYPERGYKAGDMFYGTRLQDGTIKEINGLAQEKFGHKLFMENPVEATLANAHKIANLAKPLIFANDLGSRVGAQAVETSARPTAAATSAAAKADVVDAEAKATAEKIAANKIETETRRGMSGDYLDRASNMSEAAGVADARAKSLAGATAPTDAQIRAKLSEADSTLRGVKTPPPQEVHQVTAKQFAKVHPESIDPANLSHGYVTADGKAGAAIGKDGRILHEFNTTGRAHIAQDMRNIATERGGEATKRLATGTDPALLKVRSGDKVAVHITPAGEHHIAFGKTATVDERGSALVRATAEADRSSLVLLAHPQTKAEMKSFAEHGFKGTPEKGALWRRPVGGAVQDEAKKAVVLPKLMGGMEGDLAKLPEAAQQRVGGLADSLAQAGDAGGLVKRGITRTQIMNEADRVAGDKVPEGMLHGVENLKPSLTKAEHGAPPVGDISGNIKWGERRLGSATAQVTKVPLLDNTFHVGQLEGRAGVLINKIAGEADKSGATLIAHGGLAEENSALEGAGFIDTGMKDGLGDIYRRDPIGAAPKAAPSVDDRLASLRWAHGQGPDALGAHVGGTKLEGVQKDGEQAWRAADGEVHSERNLYTNAHAQLQLEKAKAELAQRQATAPLTTKATDKVVEAAPAAARKDFVDKVIRPKAEARIKAAIEVDAPKFDHAYLAANGTQQSYKAQAKAAQEAAASLREEADKLGRPIAAQKAEQHEAARQAEFLYGRAAEHAAEGNSELAKVAALEAQSTQMYASLANKNAEVSSLRAASLNVEHVDNMKQLMDSGLKQLADGRFADPWVAEVVSKYSDLLTPDAAKGLWKTYDTVTSRWKAMALLSPHYPLKHIWGGIFNNSLMNMDSRMYKLWAISQKAFNEGGIEAVSKEILPGHVMSMQDAFKKLLEDGVQHRNTQMADLIDQVGTRRGVVQGIGGKLGAGEDFMRRAGRLDPTSLDFEGYMQIQRGAAQVQRGVRSPLYLDTLLRTGDRDLALSRVARAHFDYSDLSKFEKKFGKRGMAFYTWARKNYTLQLHSMVTQPAKYQKYAALVRNIELGTPADKTVPSYYEEAGAIRLPFKLGGNRVYATPDLPFTVMGGVTDTGGLLSSMNPIPKTFLESITNHSFFENRPFSPTLHPAPAAWVPVLSALRVFGGALGMPKVYKAPDGTLMLNENAANRIESMVPLLGRLRRLAPSEEKYQSRATSNWISFALGLNNHILDKAAIQGAQLSEKQRQSDQSKIDKDLGQGANQKSSSSKGSSTGGWGK